jgi:hypothetical protein
LAASINENALSKYVQTHFFFSTTGKLRILLLFHKKMSQERIIKETFNIISTESNIRDQKARILQSTKKASKHGKLTLIFHFLFTGEFHIPQRTHQAIYEIWRTLERMGHA